MDMSRDTLFIIIAAASGLLVGFILITIFSSCTPDREPCSKIDALRCEENRVELCLPSRNWYPEQYCDELTDFDGNVGGVCCYVDGGPACRKECP